VLAAAPSNDAYGGRVSIGALPFSANLDTTEATTDADDLEANSEECGAPATDASVWYELTGSDVGIVVDVSGSDYSAGVIIVTGSPGTFSLVTCGPGGVGFFADSGVVYSILAFDDQLDGGVNGGNLSIVVDELPPPPAVDITIDPVGRFNAQTGAATLSGKITCTEGAFAFVGAGLRQRVGRFFVSGGGGTEVACNGSEQLWSVEVQPEFGVFKGGKAQADAFAEACSFDCGFDEDQAAVTLRR
jgi:hypothetical protein